MKKKIAIIGANNFQNRLILKAKELGFETHVFAWECGDIGESTADFFYPISIIEKDRILDECKKIRPVAVVSIGSDLAVLTVNYVSRALKLFANSEESDYMSTNKYEMRKALQRAGIPVPHFVKITSEEEYKCLGEFSYPVIVKPTDRSGSRAITKVEKQEEIGLAVRNAVSESFEHAAIAEEFIRGKEYSCECISFEGEHHLLAFTEKFTTGAPHYIEIGHIQPANIPNELQDGIKEKIFAALDALQIKNGATHTEFKIDSEGNWGIIEIGARMGGDCIGSDLVPLSTGNDYMKMVIDVASGKPPVILESRSRIYAGIRFIMKEDDLRILEKAQKVLDIIYISEIDNGFNTQVSDSSNRHGFFIAISKRRDQLEKVLFGD
ncbi:ATP-grasp domain-containing protein [Ruminococcus sp. AF18-22]|nr:ATP-grasp domain-containing protein [Ruminococcus sp. AF18-22]